MAVLKDNKIDPQKLKKQHIADIRFENLKNLLKQFAKQSNKKMVTIKQFAIAADINPSYMNQLYRREKNIGTSIARRIESKFSLPDEWFDSQQSKRMVGDNIPLFSGYQSLVDYLNPKKKVKITKNAVSPIYLHDTAFAYEIDTAIAYHFRKGDLIYLDLNISLTNTSTVMFLSDNKDIELGILKKQSDEQIDKDLWPVESFLKPNEEQTVTKENIIATVAGFFRTTCPIRKKY